MSGYFPSMNYDPMNPTAWSNGNKYSAAQGVQSTLYGPMRSAYTRPNYMPNIASQQRFANYNQQSSRTNLYVSGFPTDWTSVRLRQLFEPFGQVSEVKVITKPSGDPNRGAAFVHFGKSADASKAFEEIKKAIPEGCLVPVVVRFANAGKNGSSDHLRAMRVSITRSKPETWNLESAINVYVSQLPFDITEEKVRTVFSVFGVIKSMKVQGNNEKGTVAFVHYESPEEALKAVVEMDEKEIEKTEPPTKISVRFANINKSKTPEWFTMEHLKSMQTTSNVYVTQVPHSWTEKELSEFFSKYGKISEVKVLSKKDNIGGVAFVHFEKSISACKAVLYGNESKVEEGISNNILVTFARMDTLTFERLIKNTYSPMDMTGMAMGTNYGTPMIQQAAAYYAAYGNNMSGGRA